MLASNTRLQFESRKGRRKLSAASLPVAPVPYRLGIGARMLRAVIAQEVFGGAHHYVLNAEKGGTSFNRAVCLKRHRYASGV
jgi:hypothetical protein